MKFRLVISPTLFWAKIRPWTIQIFKFRLLWSEQKSSLDLTWTSEFWYEKVDPKLWAISQRKKLTGSMITFSHNLFGHMLRWKQGLAQLPCTPQYKNFVTIFIKNNYHFLLDNVHLLDIMKYLKITECRIVHMFQNDALTIVKTLHSSHHDSRIIKTKNSLFLQLALVI